MKEHFSNMLEARTLPPHDVRSFGQRMIAATAEFGDIQKSLLAYRKQRTALNGTQLFIHFSRMFHEMITDPYLRDRLIQHLEQELKSEFPAESGRLIS